MPDYGPYYEAAAMIGNPYGGMVGAVMPPVGGPVGVDETEEERRRREEREAEQARLLQMEPSQFEAPVYQRVAQQVPVQGYDPTLDPESPSYAQRNGLPPIREETAEPPVVDGYVAPAQGDQPGVFTGRTQAEAFQAYLDSRPPLTGRALEASQEQMAQIQAREANEQRLAEAARRATALNTPTNFSWSPANYMQLQSLRQQAATMEQRVARGEWLPEHAAEAVRPIQAQIQQLVQRQQYSEMSQQELQRARMADDMAWQASIRRQNTEFFSGDGPRRSADGRYEQLKPGGPWVPSRAVQQQAAIQQRNEERRTRVVTSVDEQLRREEEAAQRRYDRMADTEDRPKHPYPAWYRPTPPAANSFVAPSFGQILQGPPSYEEQREARRQQLIRERMQAEGSEGGQPGPQPTPWLTGPEQPNAQPAAQPRQDLRAGMQQFAGVLERDAAADPAFAAAVAPIRALVAQPNVDPAQIVAAAQNIPPEVRRRVQLPPAVFQAAQEALMRQQDRVRVDPTVANLRDISEMPVERLRRIGTNAGALLVGMDRNDPVRDRLLRVSVALTGNGLLGRNLRLTDAQREAVRTEIGRLPPDVQQLLLGTR